MRDYNGWEHIFLPQFEQPYFVALKKFLLSEYKTKTIYPKAKDIFAAFDLVAFDDVKVVILGQDPYANPRQAMGLAFSVCENVPLPPSLKNILAEVERDTGKKSVITSGNLTPWAKQGVLLLNSVLTVEEGKSASHRSMGWETFTDSCIKGICQRENPLVFMLWGRDAQSKQKIIDSRHFVLTAPHPSPLSCYHGFSGCGHFSAANNFLVQRGQQPIEW